MRKAKIVCTIGPASDSPTVLDQLIESGMDAAARAGGRGGRIRSTRSVRPAEWGGGRVPVEGLNDAKTLLADCFSILLATPVDPPGSCVLGFVLCRLAP